MEPWKFCREAGIFSQDQDSTSPPPKAPAAHIKKALDHYFACRRIAYKRRMRESSLTTAGGTVPFGKVPGFQPAPRPAFPQEYSQPLVAALIQPRTEHNTEELDSTATLAEIFPVHDSSIQTDKGGRDEFSLVHSLIPLAQKATQTSRLNPKALPFRPTSLVVQSLLTSVSGQPFHPDILQSSSLQLGNSMVHDHHTHVFWFWCCWCGSALKPVPNVRWWNSLCAVCGEHQPKLFKSPWSHSVATSTEGLADISPHSQALVKAVETGVASDISSQTARIRVFVRPPKLKLFDFLDSSPSPIYYYSPHASYMTCAQGHLLNDSGGHCSSCGSFHGLGPACRLCPYSLCLLCTEGFHRLWLVGLPSFCCRYRESV